VAGAVADSVDVIQVADADELTREHTAVVVDVLRASSTIAIALDGGACEVHPVRSVDEARQRGSELEDAVLVGERDRGTLEGFVDNSPARVTELDLDDRPVVLTTTNGTRALHEARGAGRVLAGALVNESRLVEAVRGEDVALVAAGWRGDPAADDDACCAYLAERLRGAEPSVDDVIEALEASTSAVELRKAGKGADVDLCLSRDVANVVPEFDGRRIVAARAQR
jgi:2-phosphosulfolactate phosphatase